MVFRLSMCIASLSLIILHLDVHSTLAKRYPTDSSKSIPTTHLCGSREENLTLVLKRSRFVLAGRFRQRSGHSNVRLRGDRLAVADQKFNASILITTLYANSTQISDKLTVGTFYTPTDSLSRDVGCLDAFYRNSKYVFFLNPVPGDGMFYEMTANPVPFTQSMEQKLYTILCDKCDSPTVTNLPNQEVEHGTKLIVTCVASATPTPKLTWVKDGKTLSSMDNSIQIDEYRVSEDRQESVLEIDNLIRIDSGEYKCLATNPLGKASSSFKLREYELIQCSDEHQDYCLNGGQCFMLKADRNVLQCSCHTPYYGAHCERTALDFNEVQPYSEARDIDFGIKFKEMAGEIIRTLSWSIWISLFINFLIMCFICFFRYKNRSSKPTEYPKPDRRQRENQEPILRRTVLHSPNAERPSERMSESNLIEANESAHEFTMWKQWLAWCFITLTAVILCIAGCISPYWIQGSVELDLDHTQYEVVFNPLFRSRLHESTIGLHRRCVYPEYAPYKPPLTTGSLVDETVTRQSVRLRTNCGHYSFAQIPHWTWRVSLILLVIASAILVYMAFFLTMSGFDLSIFLSSTVIRVSQVMLLLSGALILSSCFLFPFGWKGNTEIQQICGSKSSIFNLGRCRIGWAYYITLLSGCFTFFGAFLPRLFPIPTNPTGYSVSRNHKQPHIDKQSTPGPRDLKLSHKSLATNSTMLQLSDPAIHAMAMPGGRQGVGPANMLYALPVAHYTAYGSSTNQTGSIHSHVTNGSNATGCQLIAREKSPSVER